MSPTFNPAAVASSMERGGTEDGLVDFDDDAELEEGARPAKRIAGSASSLSSSSSLSASCGIRVVVEEAVLPCLVLDLVEELLELDGLLELEDDFLDDAGLCCCW